MVQAFVIGALVATREFPAYAATVNEPTSLLRSSSQPIFRYERSFIAATTTTPIIISIYLTIISSESVVIGSAEER